MEDFILIHKDSVSKETCSAILEHFNYMVEKGYFRTSQSEGMDPSKRKDICAHFPADEIAMKRDNVMPSDCLPQKVVENYFQKLGNLVSHFQGECLIPGRLFCPGFKVHQVNEGNGYFDFHIENDCKKVATRVLAFMTYIEKPDSGGETEFLFQKKRVDPEVGTTIIWPAYFTHPHRGNPVLQGRKTYITGWYSFN